MLVQFQNMNQVALEPSIESIKKLAELFEISIDELLNDEKKNLIFQK